MPIMPIILCGGEGRRLMPLSSSKIPKSFLPLLTHKCLLEDTIDLLGYDSFMVVSTTHYQDLVTSRLKHMRRRRGICIFEEAGKGTASALLAASMVLYAQGLMEENPTLLMMPSDLAIVDRDAFYEAIDKSEILANTTSSWVMWGSSIQGNDHGYGHIHQRTGTPQIKHFIEKPKNLSQLEHCHGHEWLWNCGIYVVSLQRALEDLTRYYIPFIDSWARCDSLDHAVIEYTPHRLCLKVDFAWQDLGTWERLWGYTNVDA